MDDKLKKLYSLYKSSGLIKTTDFNTFSNANSAQRKKLYDLGKSSGLIKSTDFNTFNTAFDAAPIKKKRIYFEGFSLLFKGSKRSWAIGYRSTEKAKGFGIFWFERNGD